MTTRAILVDSSVWVDHFRHGNEALTTLLHQDRVLVHPFVIGEIACGTPPDRTQVLAWLAELRSTQICSLNELMAFIESHRLYGLGCGLVDLMLLASTLMTENAQLWTLDRRLNSLAERFGIAHTVR